MGHKIIKTTLISALASFVMAAGVSAAGANVLTLEATQDADSGEISLSGTTDAGVLAVACSLLNAAGEEVFFGSTAVNDKAFSETFALPVADYTMKCANYDGGDWVVAEITAPEEETVVPKAPDTGIVR